MTVKIGSARHDENGKIRGGAKGDQTGKEVATQDFYKHSLGWFILRAKDSKVAESLAKCMENACANDNIGYDQSQRLTLYNAVKDNAFKCDKKSLTTKVECDCSALVRVCLAYAGIKVANFTTSDELDVIKATKKFDVITESTSKPDFMKRGDILVTRSKGHTVIVLNDGVKVAKKSNEEIAKEVIQGKWGNNPTRKEKLTKAGYDYNAIQKIVNRMV